MIFCELQIDNIAADIFNILQFPKANSQAVLVCMWHNQFSFQQVENLAVISKEILAAR